ncbi:MAG: PorV/PorQ family protein [candidate division WOR-3 bacterium]
MKRSKLIFILLIFPFILSAQAYPGCVFLMIYPGSRQVGMGGAFSAIADDALATYYNPAGLVFQKGIDFSWHYTPWPPGLYPGMHYLYIASSLPLRSDIALALFLDYLNTGKVVVINSRGEYLGEYTPYDYALGFSFAYRLIKNLGFGLNLKYIYSFLFPEWAWRAMPELGITEGGRARTFAFDFGTLFSQDFKVSKIGIALALQNLGPGVSYTKSEESDPLPYSIRAGFSYTVPYLSILRDLFHWELEENWLTEWLFEKSYILCAYDLREDLYFEDKPWHSIGIEFSLGPISWQMGRFFDRNGWREGSTWGMSLDIKFLRLQYGTGKNIYSFPTDNRRFTLSFNFGKPILPTGYILK